VFVGKSNVAPNFMVLDRSFTRHK